MATSRLAGRLSLLLLAFAAAVSIAALATGFTVKAGAQAAPTIQSDKADYPPGGLVTLDGSGWQPNESVNIVVNDDQGQTWNRNVSVSADANGRITDQFNLPDWFVATYSVRATGASGAVATSSFTDASLRVHRGPTGNPPNVTFDVTYQVFDNAACTIAPGTPSTPVTINSDAGTNLGGIPQNAPYVKLTASANPTAPSGYAFDRWTKESTGGTAIASTNTDRSICVVNPRAQEDHVYRATYKPADTAAPTVSSINLADASPTNAANVRWTVTFSEKVTGVNAADFRLVAGTGPSGASITSVTENTGTQNPAGTAYTVTADTGTGNGTLGLNLVDDDTIKDAANLPLGGTGAGNGNKTGQVYTIQKSQATSISAVSGSGAFGGNATLTAKLASGTTDLANKQIQFKLNGQNVGTPQATNANGVATLTGVGLSGINAGSYAGAVEASFAGDANYDGASGSGGLTVDKANQTITFAAGTPTTKNVGDQDFQVNASSTSGLTVTLASSTTGVCTVSDNTVHIVGAGVCTIAASQAGNGNYNAATPVSQNISIGKANQTITFTAPTGKTFGDADFDPGATASSGLAVTYSSSTPGVCTIDSQTSKVHIEGAGTCTVTASQGGNANYNAAADVTRNITIDEKELTGSFTAANKTYDGTTAATIATRSVSGAVSGDDVGLTGGSATFADKNVGTAKTVTATGFTLSGAKAGNYTLKAGPWTTTAAVTAKPLTGSFTASSKVYDGNTDATIAASNLDGKITGDVVTLAGDTATFDNKNVGTGKTVTVGRAALSGADAGNYTLAQGPWTAKASITAKDITGSFTAANKTYDGNTDATVTGRSLSGTVTGDTVSLSGGTVSFDNKNVGTAKTVTLAGASLTGADAGNYNLTSVNTAKADITAQGITGSFTAANKVYDGSNNATVTGRSLGGTATGDTVSLTGGTATFDNKNVGTAKTVTLTGATLTGADAGNYNLTSVGTANADITALGITGNFTAANKVYDGNTDATVTGRSLNGTVTGDTVSLSGGNATFANENVGTEKTVTLAGASLTGADAGNYNLTSVGTARANITAKDITGSFTAENKTYDGDTSATIASRSVTGKVGTDDVSLSGGTATFGSASAGQGKTVTATGFTLAGTDAGNYTLKAGPWTTTANIDEKELTGSFTAADKTYDGNTSATIASRSVTGKVGTDDVSLSGGTATFGSASAGQDKTVTATGFTLTGAAKDNYTLKAGPWTTTASINEKELTGSFTASNKVYDGNTSANVTGRSLNGTVENDSVTLTGGTATFDNKNVGTGKTVTLTGATLAGADAGNYNLTSVGTANADITALGITGSFSASNKVYDGNGNATVTGRSLNGNIRGDAVSLSGGTASFDNKNVGTAKTVTLTGATLTGADAGNYNLTSVGTANADVTKAPLTVTANSESKTLGAANPTFTASIAGLVGGEDKSVLGGTLAFVTNVPNPEQVGSWNITPSGLTSNNYDLQYKNGTLTILYGWKGFLQPINDTAHQTGVAQSKFKLGQTIPVKFAIYNAAGTAVQQASNPTFTRSNNLGSCDASTTLEDPTTLSPDATTTFNFTGGQYHYNWSTKNLTAGEYRIYANLADGTKRFVDICLTK